MKKERNIQIEILRIIAMFMIVLGHAFTHGHAMEAVRGGQIADCLITGLKTITIPGTDIFVLISGYFLVQAVPNLKRVVSIWLQMFFYSFGIYLILCMAGLADWSFIDTIKYALPVSFNRYWFMSVYVYLLLCYPFLNILINNLSGKTHRSLIFLGFILMVIPASIPGISVFNPEAGNGILWFIMLYVTGAYFRKNSPQRSTSLYGMIALLMYSVAWISQVAIKYVSNLLGFAGMGSSRFSTFDSFPIYIFSMCLLCMTIKSREIKVGNSLKEAILFFSRSTAGVYMIHEHPLIRRVMWETLDLKNTGFGMVFLSTVLIFVVAAIVDHCTWKSIEKNMTKISMDSIECRISRLMK